MSQKSASQDAPNARRGQLRDTGLKIRDSGLVDHDSEREDERRYHRVSNGVWQTLKRSMVIEEEEADRRSFVESGVEAYHTPPQSPREVTPNDDPRLHDPMLTGTQVSNRLYTPSRAQLMLTLHDTIVRDLTRPEASRLPAAALEPTRVEGRRKQVISYFPGRDGSAGRTVRYMNTKEKDK